MWLPKPNLRCLTCLSKSPDAVHTASGRCSPAVSFLRMLLERDDAQRAHASRKNKVTILPPKKQEYVVKKPVGSNKVVERGCGGEEAGVLAIGPEEEDRVEDIIEVDEGVKGVAAEFDDGFERLMRIGPELFEGDRAEDMGVGDERLNANALRVEKISKKSKGNSVYHWIDNMEAMGKQRGDTGWISTVGSDDRYPRHHHMSLMAEGLAHDSAPEQDLALEGEDVNEMDSGDDDEKTVITAIEVPIGKSSLVSNLEVG